MPLKNVYSTLSKSKLSSFIALDAFKQLIPLQLHRRALQHLFFRQVHLIELIEQLPISVQIGYKPPTSTTHSHLQVTNLRYTTAWPHLDLIIYTEAMKFTCRSGRGFQTVLQREKTMSSYTCTCIVDVGIVLRRWGDF